MKKILVIMAVLMGMFSCSSLPVYADEEESRPQDSSIYGDICNDDTIDKELRKQAGCSEKRELSTVADSIINVVISIVGLVAVGVMILGGVQFVTSTGDPAKTKKGRIRFSTG